MAAKKDASTNSTGLFTLVTLLSFSLIGSVAWMATNQVVELSMKLPDYKDNLITKIRSVRHQAGGNVLEPWLYGSSTGVSSFGVILAAIFWTWLWGPIGLVLAMPLTVCVALFNAERLKKTQQRLLDSGATIVTTNMPDTIAALRRGRSFGCLDSRHTPAEPHWHDQPQSTSPLTEV